VVACHLKPAANVGVAAANVMVVVAMPSMASILAAHPTWRQWLWPWRQPMANGSKAAGNAASLSVM